MSLSFVETLPRAFGGVAGRGVIRTEPEDFFVDEVGSVEPSGEGEHVMLHVEKRNSNTEWVAKLLARHAGVPLKDVSFAGQKDRHAVTRQWFSVRMAGRPEPEWQQLDSDELGILRAERHGRKLKTGALKGNQFVIRIRGFEGDQDRLLSILEAIKTRGVPNYFGEQRFGHQDGNLSSAEALFTGQLKGVPRHKRSHYLSAARSMLFNRVLASRVDSDSWDSILQGERCLLDGSRSSFLAEEVDDVIVSRCQERDIHPTGPLWGRGKPDVAGDVLELENSVLSEYGHWKDGLERFGLEQERRSLRAKVDDLQWEINGADVQVSFFLPKGSFATALLRELVDYQVAAQPVR